MTEILGSQRHLVVTSSYPNSVRNFRGELIKAFTSAGYKVTVLSAEASPEVEESITSLGANFKSYSIKRNAIDPVSDYGTLRDLSSAYRELNPDLILAYTIKPIIWSGIAARRISGVNFIALVTGLGYAFQGTTIKRKLLNGLVTLLYRYALKNSKAVIFQNKDNRDLFIERDIVPAEKCHVVSGSGVSVTDFSKLPLPDGPPHFLLIARLLGEKGIREYAQAARMVKQKFPDAVFSLVGPTDPSPDGIPENEVKAWHDEGIIHYHGATRDVRPFIAQCHIYTLPSYHEGMPRTVLESMAMGRPILTTDVPGCRETVVPDTNGFLVPKKDAPALAERLQWMIENRDQWQRLADGSRKMAEEKFDVHKVNADMLRIMGIKTS